ncbi:MAG: hypothetical protein AB7I18_11565, partial [Candidatus Berkiella sp.]
MGMMISKAKEAIKSFFTPKNDPEKSPEFIYMSKMFAALKYPRQRRIFYRNPNAYKRLENLIKLATKFKQKRHELVFKDYLTELELNIKAQVERPMKLLQVLIEKESKQNENIVAPLSIDSPIYGSALPEDKSTPVDDIPLYDTSVAPSELEYISPNAELEYNASTSDFEIALQHEQMNILCEQFETFTLEMNEDDCHSAKRQKTCSDQTAYIDTIQIMESILFYNLWNARKEVI